MIDLNNAESRRSFLKVTALAANGVAHPLEVKQTASPRPDDLKNFSALDPLGEARGLGAVLCLAETAFPLTRDAWAFPVWAM